MENTQTYFTKNEALEDIKEVLKFYSGYYSDLHNETFNTDYYIIGTYKLKKPSSNTVFSRQLEKFKNMKMIILVRY